MRLKIDSLLAGTALALALVVFGQINPVSAQAPTQRDGVPVPDTAAPAPDTAKVSPPAIKDAQPAPTAIPTTTSTAAPAAAQAVVAPVPAATPTPETTANADTIFADKLRELVAGKLDRTINRRNERTAVEAFYRNRNFAPLWIANGAASTNAKAAIEFLAHVDRDGLDPSDYPTPAISAGEADALADAELKLTAAVLAYARHALHGRVHYSRVSADIKFSHSIMEPADVLTKLADSKDMAATLDSFQPQHPAYKALRQALADARSGKIEKPPEPEKPAVRVPPGKILRLGMKDERVIAIRKRLAISANPDSNVYDQDVVEAVTKFQKEANIGVDGSVGPNTLAAMNGDANVAAKLGNPIDTIIVNLDRWRWYQRDLGNPYVVVNIPDYRLTVYQDSKNYWTTKIVVGKPNLPTPLISADMKFITVNPTWNVPPSIIENEYLPALMEDPMALERIGLKVEQAADGTVRIFQPPGAGNALGRIRFNFPNKFLVYQHDTPDKHLFSRSRRAYSHGCMRVEDPLKYGEVLLSLVLPQEKYTAARLQKMFGSSEININFPESKHVPVHLTYQTAFVDDDGKLQLREDVYGRDARMLALLKASERRVADIAIERPPNTSAKPVRLAPGTYGPGNGYGNSGPGFLEWLFGGREPVAVERLDRRRPGFSSRAENDRRRSSTR